MAGFLLDAMDVLLYVFAIGSIRSEFHLSNAQAGLVASVTLITSAGGGIVCGLLSDRIGRKRMLIYTILTYSCASAGTATSQTLWQLVFWRALVGIGLGGEWSAGATLVSESWPPEHRAKAIGFMQSGWAIGYMAAAALSAIIIPRFGWRALFLAGVLPALVTVAIRRKVEEPPVWREQRTDKQRLSLAPLFRGEIGRRTILATTLTTAVLFAYWGLFTWLPGFLGSPLEAGGAGLNIVRTSGFVFVLQAGAYVGYLSFGWLADRFGRRPAFAAYVTGAAILTPIYGLAPRFAGASAEAVLLGLGPLVGFLGTGFFALFGAMLAELYPTSVRGAGQGFTYNFGRGMSALAPYAVGYVAERAGLGLALALNSGFFLLGALLVFTLPETRDTHLESV
jgi:MFS family permease